MATTYRIKYRTIINLEIIDKETTFISSADNAMEAVERFKKQLPIERRETFALLDVYIKHTSGLSFTTDDYDRKFSQPKQPTNWPDISPETRRGPSLPDVWRLVDVPDMAWIEDTCGVYAIINWILPADIVRLDILSSDYAESKFNMPIISFQGTTDNVRKHTMDWLAKYVPTFDLAHAAYIGAELERADTERIDFVQDGTDILACDNCGSTDDVKTYTVDQDGKQITACQKCVDRTIGPSMDDEVIEAAKVVVVVSGGAVQDVTAIPAGIDVFVHDYDTDGQDEENTKTDIDGEKYLLGVWTT